MLLKTGCMAKKKYIKEMEAGNYIFAISLIAQEMETENNPELYYNLGICCIRTGNYKKCISVFNELLEKFPGFIHRAHIYELIIYSNIMEKKYTIALQHIQERLSINAQDEKILSFQAFCEEQSGQQEKAILTHRKILELNPENTNSQNSLAFLLVHNRKPDNTEIEESIRSIKKAMSATKTNPAYLDTLGVILKKTGKIKEARTAFEKALGYAPGESEILNHLKEISKL